MLRNSFLHIPGIGGTLERQLWDSGILDWNSVANGVQFKSSTKRKEKITRYAVESIEYLAGNNPRYFADLLPANQHWRIFPEFRSTTAYTGR